MEPGDGPGRERTAPRQLLERAAIDPQDTCRLGPTDPNVHRLVLSWSGMVDAPSCSLYPLGAIVRQRQVSGTTQREGTTGYKKNPDSAISAVLLRRGRIAGLKGRPGPEELRV